MSNDDVFGCSSGRSLVVCVKLTVLLYSFVQNSLVGDFLILFYVQNLNANVFFLACLREVSWVLLYWRITGLMRHRQFCCKKLFTFKQC